MRASVEKWGNSLAVRIPKAIAEESRLTKGSAVELSLVDWKVVLTPHRRRKYSLAELLGKVTKRNRPSEWDTGKPVGKEAW